MPDTDFQKAMRDLCLVSNKDAALGTHLKRIAGMLPLRIEPDDVRSLAFKLASIITSQGGRHDAGEIHRDQAASILDAVCARETISTAIALSNTGPMRKLEWLRDQDPTTPIARHITSVFDRIARMDAELVF